MIIAYVANQSIARPPSLFNFTAAEGRGFFSRTSAETENQPKVLLEISLKFRSPSKYFDERIENFRWAL